MQFHKPLQTAKLVQRYKRFLADVTTNSGNTFTIHCPNTGAMTGCAEPGYQVWFSESENLKRKYCYTWELARTFCDDFICVNTLRANQLAGDILSGGFIAELSDLQELRAEVKYGSQGSRVDWHGLDNKRECFIEVKSVTLKNPDNSTGYFPDARSKRAGKHLQELMEVAAQGHRAVVLYVVMHTGITSVQSAAHVDPDYAQLCIEAAAKGVEFYAYKCAISPEGISPQQQIKVTT